MEAHRPAWIPEAWTARPASAPTSASLGASFLPLVSSSLPQLSYLANFSDHGHRPAIASAPVASSLVVEQMVSAEEAARDPVESCPLAEASLDVDLTLWV